MTEEAQGPAGTTPSLLASCLVSKIGTQAAGAAWPSSADLFLIDPLLHHHLWLSWSLGCFLSDGQMALVSTSGYATGQQ